MSTILLVEDDPTIRMTMEFALTKAGYAVSSCEDGRDGLAHAREFHPDLILLDIMLPGLNGFEITRAIRETDQETPIIMLTALDRDGDKVRGLDAGADDYMTKPFSTEELLARIRANMRRARSNVTQTQGVLEFGDLRIDVDNARVFVKGEEAYLRTKEYGLLLALASRNGALCRREWLAETVWQEDFLATSRTIDVHIRRIRQAVEEPSDFTYIQTVHGMGYRFETKAKVG